MPQFVGPSGVIQAISFDGTYESAIPVLLWINRNVPPLAYWIPKPQSIRIPNFDGDMTAAAGDWIVQDANGQFRPVAPGVFDALYEPV